MERGLVMKPADGALPSPAPEPISPLGWEDFDVATGRRYRIPAQIPKRKCRRCARHHGQCSLTDLMPCSFVRKKTPRRDSLLFFVEFVASIIGAALIVFCLCRSSVM